MGKGHFETPKDVTDGVLVDLGYDPQPEHVATLNPLVSPEVNGVGVSQSDISTSAAETPAGTTISAPDHKLVLFNRIVSEKAALKSLGSILVSEALDDGEPGRDILSHPDYVAGLQRVADAEEALNHFVQNNH